MGNSKSVTIESPLLREPLFAPGGAVSATGGAQAAPSPTHAPTSLRVNVVGFLSPTLQFVLAHSGETLFRMEGSIQQPQVSLLDARNVPVLNMAMGPLLGPFPTTFPVCSGAGTAYPLFQLSISDVSRTGCTISVDFRDLATGDHCRVEMPGGWYDPVVNIYLTRGAGGGARETIARIRGVMGGAFVKGSFELDVAPGVDLPLIVILWFLRFILIARRQNGRG